MRYSRCRFRYPEIPVETIIEKGWYHVFERLNAIAPEGFREEKLPDLSAGETLPLSAVGLMHKKDMTEIQSLASDILLMERGQSKTVTGKKHLERNDFIIEKQKAELQRIETAKRHKKQQVNLAEQELRQVKSEIRTDKLKGAATDAATVIVSSNYR